MITYIDDLEARIKELEEEIIKLKVKISYLEFAPDIDAREELKSQLEEEYDLIHKLYNKNGTTNR